MLARALLLPSRPSSQTMVMPLPVPRLTIDMLDDFPDDGTRYELLEGMLLVTPAPSLAHQVVATRLAATLTSALHGSGALVVAVGAIQRGKHTQLQPDVLVCPPGVRPTLNWRDVREWWLAVEVLSPSSRLYDREVKRSAYLALGVQEYWIVDPGDCSIERWSSDSQGVRATTELVWHPPAFGRAVAIDLRELFDGVCDDGKGSELPA
jgi:Uma2 family endonuclease